VAPGCSPPSLRYVGRTLGGRRSRHLLTRWVQRRCAGPLALLAAAAHVSAALTSALRSSSGNAPPGLSPVARDNGEVAATRRPRRCRTEADRSGGLVCMRGNGSRDHFRNGLTMHDLSWPRSVREQGGHLVTPRMSTRWVGRVMIRPICGRSRHRPTWGASRPDCGRLEPGDQVGC
jgi:hypothetical protein